MKRERTGEKVEKRRARTEGYPAQETEREGSRKRNATEDSHPGTAGATNITTKGKRKKVKMDNERPETER